MARKKRRVDWDKVKNDYITNPQSTYKALAKKYGVHLQSIGRIARMGNWKSKRKQLLSNVDEAVREENFDQLVDVRTARNENHQTIARNAVIIAQSMLNDLALKLKDKEYIDPVTAGRVLHVLDKAIMLERVTHNLATSVAKAEVTADVNINMRRVFDDPKLIAIAVQVGITDQQLASIGIGAISHNKGKRKR